MDEYRLKTACKDGDHEVVLDICQKHPNAVTHTFDYVYFPMPGAYSLWWYGHNVTCLHIASGYGHVECCRVLLDCGADLEAEDKYGHTPLMYAKTCEVVKLLLSRGANVNTRDELGRTALHHCASASLDKRCVGELVSAGASVTAGDKLGETPLRLLISNAKDDVRQLDFGLELVKGGADANTTDYAGRALLHRCAGKLHDCVGLEDQRSRIISELVQLGANLDARTKEGETALHIATENDQKETVCQLIKLGADVNAIDKHGKNKMLQLSLETNHIEVSAKLISSGADTNTSNEESETALHCAAKAGYTDHVQKLVKAGAGTEARDKHGNTPLLLSANHGHTQAVCALAAAGATVDVCNRHEQTAVHLAAKSGHANTVAQLVAYGAPFNSFDQLGRTPLFHAILGGFAKTAHELRKSGATLEAKDKDGNTFLHHAVKTNQLELLKPLVQAGANMQALNSNGESALLLAARLDSTLAARTLLEFGASIDESDSDGNTPLSIALKRGNGELCCELVRYDAKVDDTISFFTCLSKAIKAGDAHLLGRLVTIGASINERDENGSSALHVALTSKHLEMAEWIIEHGGKVSKANKLGQTPLHIAAANDWTSMAFKLLEAGASVEACDHEGNSPLSVASQRGNSELCCELVRYGAKVDTTISFFTCLSNAVKAGDAHLLARLIMIGASINEQDDNGSSALHAALNSKHPELAHWIMEHGGKASMADKLGKTPLHIAATHDYTSMATKLLEAGANAQARDNDRNSPLSIASKRGNGDLCCELVRFGAKVDDTISFFTCLSNAIKVGDAHLLGQLVTIGASINERGENGSCPLHVALNSKHLELSEWIIEHGGNVSVADKLGQTPLHIAARNDWTSIATKLLKIGASAEVRDNEGSSPLSVASTKGIGELCCELVRYGGKVDDTCSFFACLSNAVESGDVSLLARLVAIGASVNERDENDSSALHIALNFGRNEIAEWIIQHGGHVTVANASGMTPLHIAAQTYRNSLRTRLYLVRLLLEKGADPTAVTSRSETALDLAKQRGDYNVVTVLEKAELAHELVKAGGVVGSPDSVAIRFGGPPGAGKSTLTAALQVTRVRGFIRYESQTDEGATNVQQRTKGIKCHDFVDEKSSRFTIFDLGGPGEFLATHQMFIGDGSVPVIDCVVVSALDEKLKENAFKWCSLFASRNQPVATPWPLLLIATRADKATQQQKNAVIRVYRYVEQTFSDHFLFPCSEPLFIDARKSWNELTVQLRQVLNQLHRELVDHRDSQRKPAICQRVEENLPALVKTTSSPVILKEKFIKFMLPRIKLRGQTEVEVTPAIISLFDKALKYLSGYATVLSFSQSLVERYVVISPQWLLSDIVGRLMAEPPLPGPHVHYDYGYAKTSKVVTTLETEHLPGHEALEMVSGLGFCLEQKSTDTVLNPSKLRAHRLDEHWRRTAIMVVNAGRRLKCKGAVAIASAFFSQLQVHFYHRYLPDYDQRLPMWTRGIRLVPRQRSSVEAIIESDPSNLSIDIIVRGRQGSEMDCSDLLHSLTEETLQKATEISPGSQLRLFFSASWSWTSSRRPVSHHDRW